MYHWLLSFESSFQILIFFVCSSMTMAVRWIPLEIDVLYSTLGFSLTQICRKTIHWFFFLTTKTTRIWTIKILVAVVAAIPNQTECGIVSMQFFFMDNIQSKKNWKWNYRFRMIYFTGRPVYIVREHKLIYILRFVTSDLARNAA